MALSETPSAWHKVPDEILLQIINYLQPRHITSLQLVSQKTRRLCLDDRLWKRLCFDKSAWYRSLQSRADLSRPVAASSDSHHDDLKQTASEPASSKNGSNAFGGVLGGTLQRKRRKVREMTDWDPFSPAERISWYDEYIQRQAPACVNWLEPPRIHERGLGASVEVRGMALYNPYDGFDGLGTMMAVSPLDDGSVCLWDVKGSRGRQGRIVATSRPNLLFVEGAKSKGSNKIDDTGVTECVSVNSNGHKAFFAIQNYLIEVDLHRLEVVSRESFECPITTLSACHDGVPLSIGITRGIHLHDFRQRARPLLNVAERLDGHRWNTFDAFQDTSDSRLAPTYAPLSEPYPLAPISILHLPPPGGSHDSVSNDIFVSGRFSNILHYDRRKFPALVDSIWSGALIKSLASSPYPFKTFFNKHVAAADVHHEQLATEPLTQPQSRSQGHGPGQGQEQALIAGGGYNSKGSLEIYSLGATSGSGGKTTRHISARQNRQSAASSTILSVTNHGTKIAFSDGSGFLKWFERDGFTECRHIKIGHNEAEEHSSLFASMPASDDLARKILSTKSNQGYDRPNEDNILLWTGEKLGMVTFSTRPLFNQGFGVQNSTAASEDERRAQYTQQMRRALKRQAEEVKFIGRLGSRQFGAL